MKRGFEAVYRDHYERLFTLAFRLTGKREDAEDVLQDAFLEAYRAYPSFRGDSSAYTWLYRILVNRARRYRRVRARLPILDFAERLGMSVDEAFSHAASFGRSEDAALANMVRENCLQMFMNCMPARYRAVFTLRTILGFSGRECADILEISENAVRVCHHRARALAQDHYGERCSLVSPKGPCKCRAFAAYRAAVGLPGLDGGIGDILADEARATGEFDRELGALMDIDRLYATRFTPGSYGAFVQRMRRLRKEGGLALLGASKAAGATDTRAG